MKQLFRILLFISIFLFSYGCVSVQLGKEETEKSEKSNVHFKGEFISEGLTSFKSYILNKDENNLKLEYKDFSGKKYIEIFLKEPSNIRMYYDIKHLKGNINCQLIDEKSNVVWNEKIDNSRRIKSIPISTKKLDSGIYRFVVKAEKAKGEFTLKLN